MSEKSIYSTGFEPDDTKIEAVHNALISWYEVNGRNLPWRRTRDPWRILVSEADASPILLWGIKWTPTSITML